VNLITNYELFKNMSVENLAVTIMCPNDMGLAEIECDKSDDHNCSLCCLEWLMKDAGETEGAENL
jgi:hypothetical protein